MNIVNNKVINTPIVPKKKVAKKAKPIRSIGYYKEPGYELGSEYILREDGTVYYRERYYSEVEGRVITSELTPVPHLEELFAGTPEEVQISIGIRPPHKLIKTTKIKFPRVKKIKEVHNERY